MSTSNPATEVGNLLDEEHLGRLLLDRAIVTQQEYELVKRQAEATGIETWRLLLNLNLISPEMLNTLVSSNGSDDSSDGDTEETSSSNTAAKTVAFQRQVGATAVRETLARVVTSGDAPQIVEFIFAQAFASRATDIHLDPQEDSELRVRYRIDGELLDVVTIPGGISQGVISRMKILANMDITQRRDAQDGHIVQHIGDAERNLRIATLPSSRGERAVARILDEQSVLVGLDKLGFDDDQIESVSRLLRKPYGIIVVTGPVGSGKTTTLYSCMNNINLPTRNVMTIEDPVEYNLSGINQLQVDPKSDWTFPKALRAMMRQDPDVIMVGEIRDDETAKIAVRASLTGVLVLSSMHANDAASTVGTFYNYGIPGFLISTSLHGVIAQRLVRKINQDAFEEFVPDEKTREILGIADGEYPDLKLRRGRGTSGDFGTGYLGRTGVFEVMEVDDMLRDMIFRETTKDVIHEVAIDMGMTTLKQNGIKKVIDGITTLEEVYRVALF